MKKKLTVNTLAFGNLKARKKQYLLMTVGIIAAMVFSSGILFFISGIISGEKDLMDRAYGRENVILFGASDEMLEYCKENVGFEKCSDGEIFGFAFDEDESLGTSVAALSDRAREDYYTVVLSGRYPEKAGEIAMEADALTRMKLSAAPGDKITLSFKPQSGTDRLPGAVKKTYTLTGILSNRRKNIYSYESNTNFLPAAFVSAEEMPDAGSKPLRVTFVSAEKLLDNSYSRLLDACELFADDGISMAENVLFIMKSPYGIPGVNELRSGGALAGVLAGVLMLVSCIGIVNAFNTNLKERKKQIGLLRALGTTKRQIIKIFGREAAIIAAVAAPVSVAISYFGTKLLIPLINENMLFIPNIPLLAGGAAVSVICVMAAALIPLISASRVSPMQAVRNIDTVRKIRRKRIKQKREFSVPTHLAKRNLSLSRGTTAAVTAALAVCILLSSAGMAAIRSAYSESGYLSGDYEIRALNGTRYDFVNTEAGRRSFGLTANEVNDVLSSPFVKSVEGTESRSINLLLERNDDFERLLLAERYNSFDTDVREPEPVSADNYEKIWREHYDEIPFFAEQEKNKKALNYPCDMVTTEITGVEPRLLGEMKNKTVDGKINIEKLNSGEEIILVLPESLVLCCEEQYIKSIGWFYSLFTVNGDKNGNLPGGFRLASADGMNKLTSAFPQYKAGDTVSLSMLYDYGDYGSEGRPATAGFEDCKRFDKKVKIGAVIRPGSVNNYYYDTASVITTNSGLRSFGVESRYTGMSVFLKEECTPEIDRAVSEILDSVCSGTGSSYISEYQLEKNDENSFRTVLTGLASIIALIFTLCAVLINNSISARIRENKREIGTLRAVGASVRELTRSYTVQLAVMLGTGFGVGFGIYELIVIGVRIFEKVTSQTLIISFSFIPLAPLVICALLFVICSASLYVRIRRLTKDSIVENIREL